MTNDQGARATTPIAARTRTLPDMRLRFIEYAIGGALAGVAVWFGYTAQWSLVLLCGCAAGFLGAGRRAG